MSKRRIIVSVILSAVLMLTVGITPLTVFASLPDIVDSAEPTFAGYRIKDIKNWDPETDPYAKFLRASVPLAKRNEPFAATQANPELSADAQVMLMQSDYGNNFFNSTTYTDEFSMVTMNFWQYVDFFCPWHGAATAYTPEALLNQDLEFGIVNIPNPAYTNAAHKNGVRSIACIYLDPNFRPGQTIRDLTWDGIADKLIAMAEYYGFDGYFFNNEELNIDNSIRNELIAMMKKITEHGLWTQYYNTASGSRLRDALGSFNAVFSQYGTHSSASDDKEWTNSQSWSGNFKGDFNDKYFYGMECNQARFNQRHNSTSDTAINNLKKANASVALFEASTFYQRDIDTITSNLDNGRPASQTDAYQKLIEERERIFFSGGNQDPSDTSVINRDNGNVIKSTDTVTWRGVADMIVERSVIGGTAFYTNFNTGHGMQYFVGGKVSNDHEWTSDNLQDILPSWQWWVSGENGPSVDYDYGTKLVSRNINGELLTPAYSPLGGYTGGSSLVVYGDIGGENVVHLYKTDLLLSGNSEAQIVCRKSSNDDVKMYLNLIFEQGKTENVEIVGADKQSDDWQTFTIDLSPFVGAEYGKLEAVNLGFEGETSGYQMNIGGITITDGGHTPSAPTGLKIENAYADGQLIVSWDEAEDMAENYGTVKQYNLYAVTDGGERRFLGGIYGSLLYAKVDNAAELGEIKGFELRAVGADGSESEPCEIAFDYDDEVSNISVDEEVFNELVTRASTPNELSVHWTAPKSGAPDRYELEVTVRDVKSDSTLGKTVFRASAPGNATSATVPIAVGGEGYRYDLKIYSVRGGERGEATCYRGWTNDSYAQPVSADDIVLSNGQLRIVDPDTVDWYKMRVYIDGTRKADFLRGTKNGSKTNSMLTVSLSTAQTNGCEVKVTLTDYAGNSSDTTVKIENGKVVSDGSIGAEQFRDSALLEAVKAQIGDELDAVSNFDGTLDLTGTEIADLTGIELIGGLTGLKLKNCTSLENIFIDNANLAYIDISGCTKLKALDVSGLKLEKIDCDGTFSDLKSLDISGNRLDLTPGTPERKLVDAAISSNAALKFDGQDPIPYLDLTKSKSAEREVGSGKLDVRTLMGVVTARGNDFASLGGTINGVSFLSASFDASKTPSDSVSIKIVDKDSGSEVTGFEIDLGKVGNYEVTFTSGTASQTVTVTVKQVQTSTDDPTTTTPVSKILTIVFIVLGVCIIAGAVIFAIVYTKKRKTNK